MRIRILIISLLICVGVSAQSFSLWATYGQSDFTYSPGLELNYSIKNTWGIQLGLNSVIIYPEEKYLVQAFDGEHFELFNNVNLNLSKNLLSDQQHRLGVSVGLKAYLGTNYKELHYYEEDEYAIYANMDNTFAYFGVDFGLSYSYKKMSFLMKYDTALNKLRLGVGCYLRASNK